jgi:hypothetical protein
MMTKKITKKEQAKRFHDAAERISKMQALIEPYTEPMRIIHLSTTGKWEILNDQLDTVVKNEESPDQNVLQEDICGIR